jgi:uncharacterized protein
MFTYLDSVIIIYAVEGLPPFRARALARLAASMTTGDPMAVSDLTALECRVKPMRMGDVALLADYDAFLGSPNVTRVALSTSVYERATEIRARHNFKLGDSLHLAAAVEAGCQVFLTNDTRLGRFRDIVVDVLP